MLFVVLCTVCKNGMIAVTPSVAKAVCTGQLVWYL